MSAPDLTKKIVGFREFDARRGGLEAIGIGKYHWWPGVNKARCLAGGKADHEAPGSDCHCGLYAFHDIPEGWGTRADLAGRTVGAAILAWGRVELHHNGFRAEYAEVGLLAYDKLAGPKAIARIKRRAKDFDVPAVDVSHLKDALVMLDGERVPNHMLPEKPERKKPTGGFVNFSNWISSYGGASIDFGWGQPPEEPTSDVVDLPEIRDRLSDLGVQFPKGYRADESGLWTP